MAITASILVCARDAGGRIGRFLESAFAQRFSPDRYEIVLVDNGSRDGTADAAMAWARSRPLPELKVVCEPTRGKSRALNTGLASCRGRWVGFVDDDVALAPGWVAEMDRALSMAGVDGAGGRILPAFSGRRPVWATPAVLSFTAVHDLGNDFLEYRPPLSSPVGAAWAASKAAIDATGAFDPGLGVGSDGLPSGEEVDYHLRMAALGLNLVYQPAAVAWHLFDSSRLSRRGLLARALKQGGCLAHVLARHQGPGIRPALALLWPATSGPAFRSRTGLPVAVARNVPGKNLFHGQLKAALFAGYVAGVAMNRNPDGRMSTS
ncbi:MAG: glycosyltransferase family 2 protein [Desulfatibacillaceae bacterium]